MVLRLDYKRTFFVGLAFMSVCAFWQLYDNVVPLILKNTFGIGDTVSGAIMALDNILALFLLPLFGALSDKTRTPWGRRTPYIVLGTFSAILLMLQIPLFEKQKQITPFIIVLGLLLISLGTYRSPAVALMPDVTPKQLRSKANAVINLMGALGGVYTLAVSMFLLKKTDNPDYFPAFLAVAVLMAAAVAVLLLTIREPRLVAQMEAINYGEAEEKAQVKSKAEEIKAVEGETVKTRLDPSVLKSLSFLLASIFCWFMGYNAVTTAFTKYAQEMWQMSLSSASSCLMVATVAAVASYLPIGIISSKIGRRKTIMGGIALLAVSFASGFAFTAYTPLLNVMFGLVGIAWAAINVNSYPMVVEMVKGSDTGKYTGLYYIFSMSAQTATPILSGALLEHVSYSTLFPYAAVFVSLSFITMIFVKHGDNRPKPAQSKLEAFNVED